MTIWTSTVGFGIYHIQKPPINTRISNGVRDLKSGQSLHLHPLLMYASSERSGHAQTGQSLCCLTVQLVPNF